MERVDVEGSDVELAQFLFSQNGPPAGVEVQMELDGGNLHVLHRTLTQLYMYGVAIYNQQPHDAYLTGDLTLERARPDTGPTLRKRMMDVMRIEPWLDMFPPVKHAPIRFSGHKDATGAWHTRDWWNGVDLTFKFH